MKRQSFIFLIFGCIVLAAVVGLSTCTQQDTKIHVTELESKVDSLITVTDSLTKLYSKMDSEITDINEIQEALIDFNRAQETLNQSNHRTHKGLFDLIQ